MDESQDPALATPTEAELIARLAILAETDRPAYRKVRALLWDLYVENSGRSDFPSNPS